MQDAWRRFAFRNKTLELQARILVEGGETAAVANDAGDESVSLRDRNALTVKDIFLKPAEQH